jgi:hypothetical protein
VKSQSAWLLTFDRSLSDPASNLCGCLSSYGVGRATAGRCFAAADNASWPYSYNETRQESRLEAADAAYRKKLEEEGLPSEPETPGSLRRLDDALKIVTDGNYCVKCHIVADYSPTGSNRAKAPNLANVYRRLRPEFARNWIANPKMILPYTSMPVNINFDPADPEFGKFLGTKVSQDLYHGTSIDQVDALVDLLMKYDQFARESKKIAGMVKPLPPAPPEGAAPAETTTPAPATSGATPRPTSTTDN